MALFWLPLLLVGLQGSTGSDSIALFQGSSLQHWMVEHVPIDPKASLRIQNGPLPKTADGAVHLTRAPGWLRTKRSYADFRLAFDYRRDAFSHAGLYFRSWSRLDRTGTPGNGYEVSLGDGLEPRSSGRVIAHGRTGRHTFDPEASRSVGAAAGTWHHVIVECRGNRAEVRIDNQLITLLTEIENPAGYIGLRGENGIVEVREMVLTELPREGSGRIAGERDRKGAGLVMPRLLREVKPAYTADAMRERITGAVWLEAVVREDGTIGDIEVIRSLDPHFGLDNEALRALRQWRFAAGSKDGKPVPVVVTVELTFTLK
jgi:TonB family protein